MNKPEFKPVRMRSEKHPELGTITINALAAFLHPDLKKEMPTVVATHNTYTGRAIEHPINPFSIAARDIREEYENRYGK